MSSNPSYSFAEKFKIFLIFAVGYAVFYIFPNFYATWQPAQIPLSRLDKIVPFVPWTFLIYTSDYFLIASAILMISEKKSFNSFGRMMFLALFICGLFFLFLPTTYPRPAYPLVDSFLIQVSMDLVYLADSPNNCFPSMHVALTTISAWCLRRRQFWLSMTYAAWTFAVIVSTMTTKQHYFVDILGGLSVVCAVIMIEEKVVPILLARFSKLTKNIEISKFNKVF